MGYRHWKGAFRQPVRRRSGLRRIADFALFCVLAAGALYAIARFLPERTVEGSVHVIDGDSLVVDGQEVRLTGIDAPEYRQTCQDKNGNAWPCGKEAAGTLRRLIGTTPVVCTGGTFDIYDRLLARCTAGTVNLNREMVRLGFALSGAEQGFAYRVEQADARDAGRGIWRGPFVQPHEWRETHGRGATK